MRHQRRQILIDKTVQAGPVARSIRGFRATRCSQQHDSGKYCYTHGGRISLDASLGIRYNGKRTMAEDLSPYLPLSAATLHVLLALAGEDRHGYGIMQEVARQSEGQYKLGPGTLYDNLQKMMNQGMVEEAPSPIDNDDPR